MASGNSATTEPARGESSRDPEKAQGPVEIESSQRQTEGGAQRDGDDKPSPTLPPRPLPPPHQEKSRPHEPLPPPHGVQYTPYEPPDEGRYKRPYFPSWHKFQLGLLVFSLMVSAVIIAVCIALSIFVAPYYSTGGYYSYGSYPIDLEFGTSASAAGLAIVTATVELLTTCMSRSRQGMHPGVLVALHLFILLVIVPAVAMTGIYATDTYSYSEYDFPPGEDHSGLRSQITVYEQVLLAFNCVLLVVHAILFIGACTETNQINRLKRRVVVVPVPVPADSSYPGDLYPTHAPHLASAAQAGGNTGPIPPQQAVLYGGYYAPPSHGPAARPQHGNPDHPREYYAPVPVVPSGPSNRNPRRSSRGSQRRSQGASTVQSTEQQSAQNGQAGIAPPVPQTTQ